MMPPIFNRDLSNMDLTHHIKPQWGFQLNSDDKHLTSRAKFIRDHYDYEYGSMILDDKQSPSFDIYKKEKKGKEKQLPMYAGSGAGCVIKK